MNLDNFFKKLGDKFPLDYREGYFDGFEAGYKTSIKNLVSISPKIMKFIAEEQFKLDKKEWKIKPPIKSGDYDVIAITNSGSDKVLFEKNISYSTDDGWQIGNNWDVVAWKENEVKK